MNGIDLGPALVAEEAIVNRQITSDPGVQQMPSIAVNPLDADHLVLAYMDYSLVDTGYAGIGVSVSQDGGDSWQQTTIPVPGDFNQGAANPIARFNDQGQVFVSFMAATFLGEQPPLTNSDFLNPERGVSDRDRGMQSNNGIFVARSDDGLSWDQPATVVSHLYAGVDVPFEVIPDLGIDIFPVLADGQPNPNYGNLYVTWNRLYPAGQMPGAPDNTGGGELMIAVSRDGGLSWETQLQEKEFWNDTNGDDIRQDGEVTTALIGVFDFFFREFSGASPGLSFVDQPRVTVGREGDIYVSAFAAGNFSVHHSTDGGASFVGPDFEDERRLIFGTDFTVLASPDGLPNNRFRTHTVRAIAADATRPGHVYAVEPISVADALGHQIDGADVFFGRSIDFGETWETTFVVGPNTAGVLNDDNDGQSAADAGAHEVITGQALPRLATDAQGNIGIIWYDTRRDPGDHLLEVFATVSTDGGQTFSPNFRLTDASFDADEGSFTNAAGGEEFYLGDFIGLAMANNTAYAAWTDTRNGNQDIFFVSYSIDPPPAPLNDRFEPNETTETATELGRVVQRMLPKLAAPPGDEDWFALQAAASGGLIVSAIFPDQAAVSPGTLHLELWDETGTNRLAIGSELLSTQGSVIGLEIRFPSNAGQRFLVHAVATGDSGAENSDAATVSYSLGLQSLTADLGTRAFASLDGTLAAGAEALYRLTAAAAGSIELQLTGGDNVRGDLNLQVLDPQTFAVLRSGEAPPAPSLTATSVEPNDSILQANATQLVGVGSVTIDGFIGDGEFGESSGDYDFFSFEAGANQEIRINLDPLESDLDGMIGLYDSAGESLELVDSGGPAAGEFLNFMTTTADTYFVAILAWQSGFPDDPFTPGGGAGVGTTGQYSVSITTEAVGPGAIERASLPIQQGQTVLLLISGEEESSGGFTVDLTNLDQFNTPENGTFFFPTGGGPSELALGDLNVDGKLDLVVANALSNTVSVLLGNGDGTFGAPRQFTVGAYVDPGQHPQLTTFGRDVTIADFNGDNLPDIVATNFASSDVSVLLGRGDGTFQPQRRFNATPAPWVVDVGDLNGDEFPDLVAIDSVHGPSTVAALLGRGDGTFAPQQTFEVFPDAGFPVPGIRLAHLDADENLDLIVSGDNTPGVEIYLGNGDGTFTFKARFDANREAPDTAVADLDADGNLDIVVASWQETGEVSVLFGNGDGTFRDPENFFAGQSILAAEIADFGSQIELPDGSIALGPPDGQLDIVVAASGVPRAIQVVGGPELVILPGILGDDGTLVGFGLPQQLAPAERPIGLDVGDVNGDGAVDVAAVDRDGILIIFGEPPTIVPNNTPATARDLGTVVHLVDQTQTIVPGHEDAYYTLTVPTEAVAGAAAEILDFSALFEATEGAGLRMEVSDSDGNRLGGGERFRVRAAGGEQLLLHVFGVEGPDGTRGSGAYTLAIDVLPQVVSVEGQSLLPGVGARPGGPTTSLVITLQGDRLDLTTAEDPNHYMVTHLGVDGVFGTADDRTIPIGGSGIGQPIVYNPGANIEVSSGLIYPTAIRQTVTMLFAEPLPAGSYVIEISPEVQAAPFNETEHQQLADPGSFAGHPVVSRDGGRITEGARIAAVDLVLEAGVLGDFEVFEEGTPFLTQLHGDLGALLDSLLTEVGDDPSITGLILDQIQARLDPALGELGQRPTSMLVVFLDPIPVNVASGSGARISIDPGRNAVTNEIPMASLIVSNNIDILSIADAVGTYTFDLMDPVPARARVGAIILTDRGNRAFDLTDQVRSGVRHFEFTIEKWAPQPDPPIPWLEDWSSVLNEMDNNAESSNPASPYGSGRRLDTPGDGAPGIPLSDSVVATAATDWFDFSSPDGSSGPLPYDREFKGLDKSGNERLEIEEFREWRGLLGEDPDEIFNMADKDHDGKLTLEEFRFAGQILRKLAKINSDGRQASDHKKDAQIDGTSGETRVGAIPASQLALIGQDAAVLPTTTTDDINGVAKAADAAISVPALPKNTKNCRSSGGDSDGKEVANLNSAAQPPLRVPFRQDLVELGRLLWSLLTMSVGGHHD